MVKTKKRRAKCNIMFSLDFLLPPHAMCAMPERREDSLNQSVKVDNHVLQVHLL